MRNVLLALILAACAVGLAVAADKPPAPAATPAAKAAPLKVCLISASAEYKSDEVLAAFQASLEKDFNASCTRIFGADKGDTLPNLDAIKTCDVMLVFARRVKLPPDQLAIVKAYFDAGRPLVGVRTASHAFQTWLEFDKEVLGGSYNNHYGKGPIQKVAIVEKAKDHPLLKGFAAYETPASLYKNPTVAADATILLEGSIPDKPTEPVAWTRLHKGGRIFYTSLGAPEDFANAGFKQMIVNALFWTCKRDVEPK